VDGTCGYVSKNIHRLEFRFGLGNHTLVAHLFFLTYTRRTLFNAAWENVALIRPRSTSQVAIMIGDDRTGAPMMLYVGQKQPGNFLDVNGLRNGTLYAWVADSGVRSPQQWNGRNSTLRQTGRFVQFNHYQPANAQTNFTCLSNNATFDDLGFACQNTMTTLHNAIGAFQFSRPEDLSTNPANPLQVVFASTGSGATFPADTWGTTYIVDVVWGPSDTILANVSIVYAGDAAAVPDNGLRSPDNLDWSPDGFIYVHEDRSTPTGLFGNVSRQEASIFQVNAQNGNLNRIYQINRSAIPTALGQVDSAPNDFGNWESSGIIDVTSLFPQIGSFRTFAVATQAHSLTNGTISSLNLVEGGQLFLVRQQTPAPVAPPVVAPVAAPVVAAPVQAPVKPPTASKECGLFGFSLFCPLTRCGLFGRILGICK
jgi:2',3'-cyclic-nucleotide 2'-phosphodiesterase / 3'-nucleotidase / 5'-nucleotidase